ncbi:MAG: type II toxin-antitoxin system HicA family toxin [bacterium]
MTAMYIYICGSTLEKLGFVKIRQSGSNVVLRHPDGRWTTVPLHKGKDVAKGLFSRILKDIELPYEEYIKHQ